MKVLGGGGGGAGEKWCYTREICKQCNGSCTGGIDVGVKQMHTETQHKSSWPLHADIPSGIAVGGGGVSLASLLVSDDATLNSEDGDDEWGGEINS